MYLNLSILSQPPLIALPTIRSHCFLAKFIPSAHIPGLRPSFKITRYHDTAHSVIAAKGYVFSLSVNRLGDFLEKRQ